ncbi:DUF924 family protein [Lysobacter sp. D1-1-M9]|uniref:DUF924 family protein n=1 Tax=Novilysobacter longmucuonensis TaxID=3098603 RepID=UPI002FCBF45B
MTIMQPTIAARDVVEFWRGAGPARWFDADEAFDAQCRLRFLDAHLRASRREYDDWMADAEGALALLLLLDQMPRNIYRGSAHVYATDLLARQIADAAIQSGFDLQTEAELRLFFYLPFTHSEDAADQQRAVELHRTLPAPGADKWALHHCGIIERFGRFPHRNALLGRTSTPEEQAFLDQGGFSG